MYDLDSTFRRRSHSITKRVKILEHKAKVVQEGRHCSWNCYCVHFCPGHVVHSFCLPIDGFSFFALHFVVGILAFSKLTASFVLDIHSCSSKGTCIQGKLDNACYICAVGLIVWTYLPVDVDNDIPSKRR